MDSADLLNRIRERDMEAYLQLTNTYGLKLYSHLYSRLDDKEAVDEAFNRTLNDFYQSLTADDTADPIESILCAFADRTCEKIQMEKQVRLKKTSGKSGNLGFILGVGILLLGIIAALWVILGLLMDMNLVPGLDLGYEWFNTHIAPWF